MVSVSVFRSKLINTSSPSLRLRVSLNSFGRTKRPLVSNLTIEFIIHLVGILWEYISWVYKLYDQLFPDLLHRIFKYDIVYQKLGGVIIKGKTLILSLSMAAIVVLAGFSSVVGSSDIETLVENSTVTIEVNKYMGKRPEQILTEVSEGEAKEIEQLLLELYDAIERNDKTAISEYQNTLNKKGIFGDENYKFYSQDEFLEMVDISKNSQLFDRLDKMQGDDISNYVCYYHAAGKGIMEFTIGIRILQAIIEAASNASSFLEALVILLALLPFYVVISLMTHLIPFRILMPIGVIIMDSGKMFSLGLGGFKSVTVEGEQYTVNVSGFTGITISIPFSENPFLFVSGVAFKVEESDI